MPKRKRLHCLLAALAVIILMLLTTACVTTRTEYVHHVPAVVFPVFPPPDCVEYNEDTDTVSMPLWYWRKIAEYKIDVDAIAEYLKKIREAGEKK